MGGGIFSVLQICLVTGDTAGIPSLASFIGTISFMPMCIMFFPMVPPGTEGTTYALISTWQNVAASVATNIGTSLACFVNVGDGAIESHNYAGMLKLTVFTSVIQLMPIFFIYGSWQGVRFLPDSMEESKKQIENNGRSNFGGTMFMIFFFGSIA